MAKFEAVDDAKPAPASQGELPGSPQATNSNSPNSTHPAGKSDAAAATNPGQKTDSTGSATAPSPAPGEHSPKQPAPQGPAKSADDGPTGETDLAGQPFPYRARIAPPELPSDMEWLNTERPLKFADLKGKYVLLDFWTYCCINCMHILPELKKLEHAYPNQLVVIGVHSAKFENEKESDNIREAILRYEIEHPVVNDNQMAIWESFYIRSWPSLRLLDPEGNLVWGTGGEVKFEELKGVLEQGLPYYRERKTLDESPLTFRREELHSPAGLRFPGKILADEAGERLFIADSNHNRIVVTSLTGQLLGIIGSGAMGQEDGDFAKATFDHPQGMALRGNTLYVADTENHLLRKVDLEQKTVTTLAGIGEQARHAWPGIDQVRPGATDDELPRWVGKPRETALNSPWALWIHQEDIYVAMAGPHQIWKMKLDESEIGPYAGNGREDIVDGPLLPRVPYDLGFSSFAQPSGLSSDGEWLFVADSEGSSIRAVPFDPAGNVRTVIGTSHLEGGRLFEFGDVDGPAKTARLQHALEVVYANGRLYVADTYNNKIKEVDPATGETKTLAGTGKPGNEDAAPTFDEPAGLAFAKGKLYVADTNNHLIRVIDLSAGNRVSTLVIENLAPAAGSDTP